MFDAETPMATIEVTERDAQGQILAAIIRAPGMTHFSRLIARHPITGEAIVFDMDLN